jgi:hypothetical protein
MLSFAGTGDFACLSIRQTDRSSHRALEHTIKKINVLFIAPKVLNEMPNDAVRFVEVPSASVRRDITIRG